MIVSFIFRDGVIFGHLLSRIRNKLIEVKNPPRNENARIYNLILVIDSVERFNFLLEYMIGYAKHRGNMLTFVNFLNQSEFPAYD